MVTQESFLFSGSVADNIAFGRPGATRDEIEAAARAIGAHEFIAALPDGYDTDVRKRGGRLSAGQRQLVAFARAFLADPAVLILDEATCSLDVPSERLVQRALQTVLADRTALIIAHRLSTVEIADRVLVHGGRPDRRGRRPRRPGRRRRPVRRAAPGLGRQPGLTEDTLPPTTRELAAGPAEGPGKSFGAERPTAWQLRCRCRSAASRWGPTTTTSRRRPRSTTSPTRSSRSRTSRSSAATCGMIEKVTGRLTRAARSRAGAAGGAWWGLFVGLLLGIFSTDGGAWIGSVLTGLLIGLVFGAVFGWMGYAATRGPPRLHQHQPDRGQPLRRDVRPRRTPRRPGRMLARFSLRG